MKPLTESPPSQTPSSWLAALARVLREPRDPFFDDAAASGELLVARIRLLLLALILVIQLFPGWDPRVYQIGVSLNIAAVAWAAGFLRAVSRRYRPWMGFVSGAIDISLVTTGLLLYQISGRPDIAANSKVLYEVYFLAIGCTNLRYDWRVCALTGALSVLQFGGLMIYTGLQWDISDPSQAPFGMFNWNVQAARVILLIAASILSTAVVLRGQRLRKLSTTDRLTELHNRGVFEERLAQEGSRASRHDRPLTLAIIDIDHFKLFNDTHGHAGGDAALRAVGRTLRSSLRISDVVTRYGGEEFALILSETPAPLAMELLERLRRAVAAMTVAGIPGASPGAITVSIGVASWPEDGSDVNEVLMRADARLYAAKRQGRNRLVGPPPLEDTSCALFKA